MEIEERFEKFSDEYLKFDRIETKEADDLICTPFYYWMNYLIVVAP